MTDNGGAPYEEDVEAGKWGLRVHGFDPIKYGQLTIERFTDLMPRHDNWCHMRRHHGWCGTARRILFAFTVIVSMVLLILLLPAIIPVVGLSHSVYRKRLRAVVRELTCSSCGAVLGLESIRLADAAWDEHMRELRARHPTIRIRVVRRVHAICPVCGARYTFLERDRALVSASMSLPAG